MLLLLLQTALAFSATQSPLAGEANSDRNSKSFAAPNSAVELVQRFYQEHRRLQFQREERAKLEADLEKTQSEADDLVLRVQSTPQTTKTGEENVKRQQVERRLATVQSRLNTMNQRLNRIDGQIEDAQTTRNSLLMALLRRLLTFLVVALVIWLLARLLRRIPQRVVKEEQDRFYIDNLITYVIRLVVVILFLYTIFGELGSFSAFLGLTGAGIAIALQDVIVSFVAWFFIIGRRGLSIGDRIEVSGVRGDVVDIGVLRIVLQEAGNWLTNDVPTGRRVFIPNSFVFKNYFFNYTKPQPFINDEIKLTFTFESKWEQAVALVEESARKVMKEMFPGEGSPELLPQNESFTHWGTGLNPGMPETFTRIAENGVEVRLVYFTRVRERNKMRDALHRAILKSLADQKEISLAYPTSRAISTPPGVKP